VRIGLFAHRLAQPDATGDGRYLRELVRALSEIVGPGDQIALTATPETPAQTWVPSRIDTAALPGPRRAVQTAWCLGAGPRIERSLGSFDVVHQLRPFPPIRTAAPQVVTLHDLLALEHPEWFPRSERWTNRRSIELAVRRAVRFVVPTAYVAGRVASMLDLDPARIEVVPLGVSGTFARARSDQEIVATCARFGVEPGCFAVCVGAVSTRKNVIALVQAIGLLGGDQIPLVMVGPDGYGAETVQREIARLDGTARVIRTGYVSDDEAAALVRGAAVLAHPALGEGFGFVPLEAMAAGTPVIAAGVSSIPEVVGDAAVLVDQPTEPTAWADALIDVVGSAERRRELTGAGERRVAGFSWERTARTMLEIYRDAARG
jgi:glycosyltransferase involved in cell wall biosynthesis